RMVGRLVLDRRVDNFFAETEQVAFCTQNIVRGIDFSDDPLLQGRNFSYLDTQLKRLGSPNFTHLPINAPKCPFHHFQQDGHMAMVNPKGRANYEPNSWPKENNPRENPQRGYQSFPEQVEGPKVRMRAESFSDHYSQARQFYISQTKTEQNHIISALTFELSKVKTLAIRERMVAHLFNIDEELAKITASNLRIRNLPEPAVAAQPTRQDIDPSPALSIIKNQSPTLRGRKVGCLVSDGVDNALINALRSAIQSEGGMIKFVTPRIGGVETKQGEWIEGDEKIDGGPSVLFDVIVIAVSNEGAAQLAKEATARDFVADAYAHLKYIGYTPEAEPLLAQGGIQERDDGVICITGENSVSDFVNTAKQLRLWEREARVKQF
ncbi:MAG: catalase, partial [Nitrosomonas sp.]|nr:catalase [Nitrosomonas sp.]